MNTPVLEDLLREIIAELRGLRADVAQRRDLPCPPGSTLTRVDRALLSRMLPAIGGAIGSDAFLVRDLFEHDSPALRLVRRGLNAKRIGRLLQRAEGQAIDGYLVERAGVELQAVLWRILQVPGFPGSGLPAVPPRAPDSLA